MIIERIFKLYRRPLVRDTIKTTIWSTIGKSVGFLIPFFIAAWFGTSSETDAFFFAYGLILFLSGIFAPVVESVIVPYIAEARANNENVSKFVGNILGISGAGLFVLTVLLLLIIKPVLSVITRFDEQTLGLIYQLLFETAPLIILLVWTSVLSGALNTYKKFTFPAILPVFRAIVNLIIIFAFKDVYGVHSIALGYVVGELIRLAVLLIVTKRLDLFKLRLSFQLNHKLMEFFKTASYQITGMVAVGFNPIVDKTMASWLGKGSVSVLHYADRLYMIPLSFTIAGLFPVVLSYWSADYSNTGLSKLCRNVSDSSRKVLVISSGVFLIFILFGKPLVNLVFAYGQSPPKDIPALYWTYICYLLGFVAYVTGSMYTRAFLVLKKTAFLMVLCFVNCFLNVSLNLILMNLFGVCGLALSTSITLSIIAGLLFVHFRKITVRNEGKE